MQMNSRKYFSVGMWLSLSCFLVTFFRTLIKSGSASPQATDVRMRIRKSTPLSQAMLEEDILPKSTPNPPWYIQSVKLVLDIFDDRINSAPRIARYRYVRSMYGERHSGNKQKKLTEK